MKQVPHKKTWAVFTSLFVMYTNTVMALTIGDYRAITKSSGVIEITQLDNASDLTVTVEIDSQDVNYEIEQIDNDSVLINLEDSLLEKKEVLIQVTAKSEYGENNRLFSHAGNPGKISEPAIADKAKQKINKIDTQPEKKVIVHTMAGTLDSNDEFEIIDGKLTIPITGYKHSVGHALRRLASANNMEVLILPGDDILHQLPLSTTVTSFEDLYTASNQQVKQIFIDDDKQLVRIVGFVEKAKTISTQTQEVPTALPLKDVFLNLAVEQNYTPRILFGDEKFLNNTVEENTINTFDQLALYVGKNGGVLDIDEQNKLLRVRKNYD